AMGLSELAEATREGTSDAIGQDPDGSTVSRLLPQTLRRADDSDQRDGRSGEAEPSTMTAEGGTLNEGGE
ncbi:hypothetical protein FRC09_001200, partial [Ceratobasidium sp. 395]